MLSKSATSFLLKNCYCLVLVQKMPGRAWKLRGVFWLGKGSFSQRAVGTRATTGPLNFNLESVGQLKTSQDFNHSDVATLLWLGTFA